MTLTNYWWVIIWIFTGGAVLHFLNKRMELVEGRWELRWNYIPALVLVAPYIIWAGYRSYSFGDTGNYVLTFNNMPAVFADIPSYIDTLSKDRAFYVLGAVLKCMGVDSARGWFVLLALGQMLILVLVLRKFSTDLWFSIFVFIAATDYFSWMFNGTRQFTAVVLIIAATRFIVEKRYALSIIFILIASQFHLSALLMLPVIFIISGEAWNRMILLAMFASMIALIYVNRFTGLLNRMLADTQYENVVSDWISWNDNGMNPLRVLVYAVPMILSLVGLKYVRLERNRVINMAVNASIITTALGIIAVGTSGIFIGRLPIYTSIWANSILLPWEIDHIFNRSSARVVKVLAIVFYLAFFFYQTHFTWGML